MCPVLGERGSELERVLTQEGQVYEWSTCKSVARVSKGAKKRSLFLEASFY